MALSHISKNDDVTMSLHSEMRSGQTRQLFTLSGMHRCAQVLAQAKQHSSREDEPRAQVEAEAALRSAVTVLREAQATGAADLKDISTRLGEEVRPCCTMHLFFGKVD